MTEDQGLFRVPAGLASNSISPGDSNLVGYDAAFTYGSGTVGLAIQSAPTSTTLAASTGSSLVGFIQSGTGAVLRTAQAKMRDIVAVPDFGTQALIEASGLNWFYMPYGNTLTVSGALAKNYWGVGKIALANGKWPGTQGDAAHGFTVIETVANAAGQHWAFAAKSFNGTRTDVGSAVANDAVAIYGEVQRGAGSTNLIWAINTVTEVYNLSAATIGYEIDMNNQSGVDPGLNPAQSFLGLSVVNGAIGRGGTAIEINRNGAYAGNQWNRGINIKEVLLRGMEFVNCGNATGIWVDSPFFITGSSAAAISNLVLTPFDDTNQTGSIFYFTNAANSLVKAQWLKRGEIAINGPGGLGTAGLSIKGIANADNIIFLQRNTDTVPTGTYLRAVNAANSLVLFEINHDTTAGNTNLMLSQAGAGATRVSLGAANSGGAGFKFMLMPN